MSKKIIVEFSGWAECDSDKVMFASMLDDSLITGSEWMKLSKDEQDDYFLEDCVEAQRTALNRSLEHLDVIVQNEDGSEVTASRTYS
tara:strand:- start:90 stop:350 length:261 start_codon:yes stop_codon:yes gene_type:complete